MSKMWTAEKTVVALAVFFLSEGFNSFRTSRMPPPASRYSAARSRSLFSLHTVTNLLSAAGSTEGDENSVLRDCPLNTSPPSLRAASSFLSEPASSRVASRPSTSSSEPLTLLALFVDAPPSFLEVRLRVFPGPSAASILTCPLACSSAHVPRARRHVPGREPRRDPEIGRPNLSSETRRTRRGTGSAGNWQFPRARFRKGGNNRAGRRRSTAFGTRGDIRSTVGAVDAFGSA